MLRPSKHLAWSFSSGLYLKLKMKRLFKFFLNILILLVVSILLIWIVISRPLNFTSDTYNPDHVISTARLTEHTKMLSERINPRDSDNPENLIKAAKYIEKVFMNSSKNVSLNYFDVEGKN